MRHSNPTVKPYQEEHLQTPWLYWEPFETDDLEAMLEYHFRAFMEEYPRWKYRLYKVSAKRSKKHLLAITRLSQELKRRMMEQTKRTPADMKQMLENPDL
jgi:hypothetical protein|tara:strand:- start:110 stop:409 length:300 start_codon:yes stop_codon:yes gene_type:complete